MDGLPRLGWRLLSRRRPRRLRICVAVPRLRTGNDHHVVDHHNDIDDHLNVDIDVKFDDDNIDDVHNDDVHNDDDHNDDYDYDYDYDDDYDNDNHNVHNVDDRAASHSGDRVDHHNVNANLASDPRAVGSLEARRVGRPERPAAKAAVELDFPA